VLTIEADSIGVYEAQTPVFYSPFQISNSTNNAVNYIPKILTNASWICMKTTLLCYCIIYRRLHNTKSKRNEKAGQALLL
jgi:hypothetical protein